MNATSFPSDHVGPNHYMRDVEGAKRLVVFFGAKDLSFEQFNFFQAGRELFESCLFLNNGANHWYQYGIPSLGNDFTSTVDTIKRWGDVLGVQEIVTVGTSMGGYGAIQYGSALGARVLAFASDAKLSEKYSQSGRYFSGKDPASCSDLCALLDKTPTDVTLLSGERDVVDLYAANQLVQVSGVKAQSLIGADHIVPTHLSRKARLIPLLRNFADGKSIPKQPDAGDALIRPDYISMSYAAFDAAQHADWERCENQARDALTAYPFGEAASLLLGSALLKQARYKEAATILNGAVVSKPEDAEAKLLLAQALRRCGAPALSRQLHSQILTHNPGAHRSHYGLGLIALEAGNLNEAAKSIRAAIRIAPKIKAYRNRLNGIEKQLGARAKKPS